MAKLNYIKTWSEIWKENSIKRQINEPDKLTRFFIIADAFLSWFICGLLIGKIYL